MILAILLQRRSDLKALGSVIEAALARGHDTRLILEPAALKSRDDRLSVKELLFLFPGVGFYSPHAAPEALVSIDGATAASVWAERRVTVDNFCDAWCRPPRQDSTVVCYASKFLRDKHADLYGVDLSHQPVVGWVNADQAYGAHLIAHKVKRRDTRDSAVFFALKMNVPEPWRKSREGRRWYHDTVHQAIDLAHAQGLRFVVKSRRKNNDPWWLRWVVDEYVFDDDVMPYTSLRLLARAKWCVHFESGAGWEAALMGVYSYVLSVPQTHIIDLPGGRIQYGGDTVIHDWKGLSQYGLEGPAYVDPVQRQRWLDTFVGNCDGRAGERVVEECER